MCPICGLRNCDGTGAECITKDDRRRGGVERGWRGENEGGRGAQGRVGSHGYDEMKARSLQSHTFPAASPLPDSNTASIAAAVSCIREIDTLATPSPKTSASRNWADRHFQASRAVGGTFGGRLTSSLHLSAQRRTTTTTAAAAATALSSPPIIEMERRGEPTARRALDDGRGAGSHGSGMGEMKDRGAGMFI